MNRPVYLGAAGVLSAAGQGLEPVWQSALHGGPAPAAPPVPVLPGSPWEAVFAVEEPTLSELGMDRRVMRTMEKQAKMAVHAAGLALRGDELAGATDKARFGLYLGLPTVEDPVPPWPVLQAMHAQGLQRLTTELCLRETPPFSALSDLNSSAGAQVSARFGMTGSMGFFSPGADAGLQAVVEAALSVAEGESDAALAGGVAPKLNPLLMLQQKHFGWFADPSRIPGEGAALLTLSAQPDPQEGARIKVGGHARGFALSRPWERRRGEVAAQALTMAGLQAGDVGWTVGAELPWPWCGDMGPASPVLALLLAAHGLRLRRRLCTEAGIVREEAMASPHALVTAQGPEGQCVAVVLTREDGE